MSLSHKLWPVQRIIISLSHSYERYVMRSTICGTPLPKSEVNGTASHTYPNTLNKKLAANLVRFPHKQIQIHSKLNPLDVASVAT